MYTVQSPAVSTHGDHPSILSKGLQLPMGNVTHTFTVHSEHAQSGLLYLASPHSGGIKGTMVMIVIHFLFGDILSGIYRMSLFDTSLFGKKL